LLEPVWIPEQFRHPKVLAQHARGDQDDQNNGTEQQQALADAAKQRSK
jgi:hypothetical protein